MWDWPSVEKLRKRKSSKTFWSISSTLCCIVCQWNKSVLPSMCDSDEWKLIITLSYYTSVHPWQMPEVDPEEVHGGCEIGQFFAKLAYFLPILVFMTPNWPPWIRPCMQCSWMWFSMTNLLIHLFNHSSVEISLFFKTGIQVPELGSYQLTHTKKKS